MTLKPGKKGQAGVSVGMVIAAIMGAVVVGLLVSNVVTDSILSSATASVNPIVSIGMVTLLLGGVAALAYVGKWIISIFG